MSLSNLAAIGSFVSGIAVLASLIFLFLQMRQLREQVAQADRNQRALMIQGAAARAVERANIMTEPHISALWARVTASEVEFTSREIVELQLLLRSFMLGGHDVYLQHREGLTDRTILDNVRRGLAAILAFPACRAIWRMSRTQYASDWAHYIDELMAETPVSEPRDIVSQFRSLVADDPLLVPSCADGTSVK